MKITSPKTGSEKPKDSRTKKVIKGAVLLLLAVSLFVYRDTLREILAGIRDITWTERIMGLLLAFYGYLLEGLTIFVMMGAVGPRAKVQNGIFIAYVCEFYRLTTLGNGSGIAEIHYLHEKGVEPGSATVLTMIQYIMKRTAIMLLGVAGFAALWHREGTEALCRRYLLFLAAGCLITAVIIALFLCIALSARIASALSWALERLTGKYPSWRMRFEKWEAQIRLLNESGKSILRQKKRMTGTICLQVGKAIMFYLIPAVFLYGKTGLTAVECATVMAVAYMLAGVIPAPSGAGALEFVFLLFFSGFTDAETAVPAILLFRFVTWICPAAVGGGLLLARGLRDRFA